MPRGELENFIETSIIHPRNGSVHPFLPFLAVNSIRITRARISRPSLPPSPFVLHFLRDFLQFGLRAISERVFLIFAPFLDVGRSSRLGQFDCSNLRRFFLFKCAFFRFLLERKKSLLLLILLFSIMIVKLTGWCLFGWLYFIYSSNS